MDNSDQNQAQNKVQFDSKHIQENQSKREGDIKFRTRLTFKDKMKKFFDKPIMRGPRKFFWLAGLLIIIAGIVVGIVWLVNLNSNQHEEGTDEWYSDLESEIQDGFANNDFDSALRKINTAIANAKDKDDKDTVRRLYAEKAHIIANRGTGEETVAMYKEMLDYFGNETYIYSALGNAQISIDDKAGALESYRNAIKYAVDDSDMGFMQAMVKNLEEELAEEK